MTTPTLTTYGGTLREVGYPGGQVDMRTSTTLSRVAQSTIEFGDAVTPGTVDGSCKAPTADTDNIIGVAVRYAGRPAASDGTVKYVSGDGVTIMEEGYIYATANEAVVAQDIAVVKAGTSGFGGVSNGGAGAGRNVLDGTTGNIVARWEYAVSNGAVGRLKVGRF